MKRKILLYGRLRDGGLGDAVSLDLPAQVTARRALVALKVVLGRRGSLLNGCALATDDAVLAASDLVPENGALAALPPVCGG